MEQSNFSDLKEHGTLSLKTYYKSGKAVPTPLEYIKSGDIIYVYTRVKSYKIKRILSNNNGTVAQCTMRGILTGPEINVVIKILEADESEKAREVMNILHNKFIWKLFRAFSKLFFWQTPAVRVYLEISVPTQFKINKLEI